MADPVLTIRGTGFEFDVPLGESPPVVSGGGAIWEEVARPERDALTDFVGNNLIQVTVPVLLDGWPPGRQPNEQPNNIAPHVRRIISLCRGQQGQRPPHFTAEGPFIYSGWEWVMQLPEMGPSVSWPNGMLVRQEMTLRLLEWNDPASIKFRKKDGKKKQGSGAAAIGPSHTAPGRVKLTRAENLLEVTARYLGEGVFRAKEVGELNNKRDIMKKWPAGTFIYLPAVYAAKRD